MSIAPYNNVRARIEDAVHGYLSVMGLPDVGVYRTAEQLALGSPAQMPFIGVHATSARPWVPEASAGTAASINRIVELRILVATTADDVVDDAGLVVLTGRDNHHAIAGAVMDYMLSALAISGINAQAQGVMAQDIELVSENMDAAEHSYATEIMFNVYAVPT